MIAAYARTCKLLGPAGSGQLTKMVNQICIAGLVQGLSEGTAFCQARRTRYREADRHHLQGRGAVLADGEPLQDHDRRTSSISALRSTGCARTCRICLGEARKNGAHLPVAALVDQFYSEVQKMGGKRWDTSSLIARLDR